MPPTTLQESGIVYAEPVAVAAAEREKAERLTYTVLDDFTPALGRTRSSRLEMAVIDYAAAIERDVTARLMEILVAIHHGDVDVFARPGVERPRRTPPATISTVARSARRRGPFGSLLLLATLSLATLPALLITHRPRWAIAAALIVPSLFHGYATLLWVGRTRRVTQ